MSSQTEKIKPSGTLYLVPIVVFLVGAVLGIILIVSGVRAYSDTIANYGRVPLNGEGVVNFSKSGKFTAFLEQPGIDSTGVFIPAVTLTMSKVDGGAPVVFKDYSGSGTYSNDGHEGAALQTFTIDEPGDYRLVTSGQGSGEVAVGRSPFGKLGRGILAGVVVGTASFLFAVIFIIVLLVKRGGAKRRIRAAQFAGAGAYGAPGYSPQQQWQPQPYPPGGAPPPSQPQPYGAPSGAPPPPQPFGPPPGPPPAPSDATPPPPPPAPPPGPPPQGPEPSWPAPPPGNDDPTRPG